MIKVLKSVNWNVFIDAGLRMASKYRFGFYDALIAAAALEADCTTLYSDFQDGQVIEGRLTVRNPFARQP